MSTMDSGLAQLLDLGGKTAVVTGAAKGIGAAVAEYLGRAGANVVVADADGEAAVDRVKQLREAGIEAVEAVVDVSREEDVLAMLDTAASAFGGVDVLVNNAGIFPTEPVLDMPIEDFRHVLDVNLVGLYLCSRHAARRMVEQGRGGRIINVTSVDSLHPSAVGLAHYDASKHGAWGFTKNLARELAPHGIWVNAIAPGSIATPGVASMQNAHDSAVDPEQVLAAFLARVPMGRMGMPEDIGRVALFLASDLASYMTGSQVVVDGGYLLS